MNKKQRMKHRDNYRKLMAIAGPVSLCVNCGKDNRDHGHFVPPSLGEQGFFICQKASVQP